MHRWLFCAGAGVQLKVEVGSSMIPHPEQAYKGGEDAFFVSGCHRSFGKTFLSMILPLNAMTAHLYHHCSPLHSTIAAHKVVLSWHKFWRNNFGGSAICQQAVVMRCVCTCRCG